MVDEFGVVEDSDATVVVLDEVVQKMPRCRRKVKVLRVSAILCNPFRAFQTKQKPKISLKLFLPFSFLPFCCFPFASRSTSHKNRKNEDDDRGYALSQEILVNLEDFRNVESFRLNANDVEHVCLILIDQCHQID